MSTSGHASVRLPQAIEARLVEEAARLRVSKSDLMRRYIEVGLDTDRDCGAIERATAADLSAFATRHPMGEALEALALRLARAADYGRPGVLPGVVKELRATLADLVGRTERWGDDPLADLFGTD